MRMIIGADVVPSERNLEYFKSGQIDQVLDEKLKTLWDSADIRVFNIEAPIINEDHKIAKAGVCLRMDEDAINGIKELNPTIVTLANNHIMDHGQKGIRNTIRILNNYDIPYVGIGNKEEAAKIKYVDVSGYRIGIYACTEHEFSVVGDEKDGANPYDPLESFDHIQEGKSHCDYLIVLYHGGREFYRYPSPELQKSFRKMALKGADLVIAQHTHCIGCYEEYVGSTLVYGQGNFIFDRVSDEFWNSGVLVDVNIDCDEKKIGFIPFIKENGCIRRACDVEYNKLMNGFNERSREIMDSKNVVSRYDEYVEKNFEKAFRVLHGNNLPFMVINKLLGGGLVYKMYNKIAKLAVLDYIECEAHRELLINGMKLYLNNEK